MPTLEEAYQEGLATGRSWPARWQHIPGGPWVSRAREEHRFQALYAHQKRVHDEWLRGWHEGFKATHQVFPDWYRPTGGV